MKRSLLIALSAALLASPALAADSKEIGKEASISFVSLGGIRDWKADGDRGLYIQGRSRKDWYYAKIMSPCAELPWAETIGFVSEPTGSFDKFSSIVVRGHECHIVSLVYSNPPPKKEAKED